MKTEQNKVEEEIKDYFYKNVHEDLKRKMVDYDNVYKVNDLVKVPFMFFDTSRDTTWDSCIITDIAVWSIKEQRFMYIEYPWYDENDEITYPRITL